MTTGSKLTVGTAAFVALNFYGGWPVTIVLFSGAAIGLLAYAWDVCRALVSRL